MEINTENSTIQKLENELFIKKNVEVYVKRDDLIHEIISGNKWRKLKYNIQSAKEKDKKGILTFGGAYSNHLHATAYACKLFSFKSIAFVRGDELNQYSNKTLSDCYNYGMEMNFINRSLFSEIKKNIYHELLKRYYEDYIIVPEGGSNNDGIKGAEEIVNELEFTPDAIFCAQGTSTTSCGILIKLKKSTKLYVVPVLKSYNSTIEMTKLLLDYSLNIEEINNKLEQVIIMDKYHFGGYGKYNNELIDFIKFCKFEFDLPLDHVYTAKVFYSLYNEILNDKFNHKKVLFIHTGGLQGSKFWR